MVEIQASHSLKSCTKPFKAQYLHGFELKTSHVNVSFSKTECYQYHNICTNFLILQLHCDLPRPPNVQTTFFSCFKMATNKTYKLKNLNCKIDREVYCCSFQVICDFPKSSQCFAHFSLLFQALDSESHIFFCLLGVGKSGICSEHLYTT